MLDTPARLDRLVLPGEIMTACTPLPAGTVLRDAADRLAMLPPSPLVNAMAEVLATAAAALGTTGHDQPAGAGGLPPTCSAALGLARAILADRPAAPADVAAHDRTARVAGA